MSSTLKKIIADFRTSLSAKIAVGGTTGTLQNATDDDGVALPSGKYFFTVDGDNSQKEHITCDLASTALTNIKSVSRQGVETSGTVREHRAGATVTITDFAHIKRINDILTGTDELDGANPLKYDADPTFTDNQSLVTKKYADDLAIAGSPDASDTTKGISKLSVAPVTPTAPIAVGDNDGRVPSQGENDALVGTSGTPSSTNKYVTNDDTATAATASKVARRLASGDITVNTTPTNATDATSKAYVDINSLTYVAGTGVTLASANTERSTTSITYVKLKEITCDRPGTFSTTFDLRSSADGSGNDVWGRIYKNGVAVGTERTQQSSTYNTYTQNLSFVKGDLIQLYVKATSPVTASVRNFQIKGTPIGMTVNTD